MTFDVQAPGYIELLVFPAVVVVLAGLLLRRRMKPVWAILIASFLPGIVLLVLTSIDEGAGFDSLPETPTAWIIWTLLSLPGTLIGIVLLVGIWTVRAIRRRRRG